VSAAPAIGSVALVPEHEYEPVRGLPGRLPPGERILWQGSPSWRSLAQRLLLVRWVAAYFGGLALWGVLTPSAPFGTAITLALGTVGVGLLCLFAWAVSRTTVYTLTNRRIVLRFGVALSKCVNLPLRTIGTAAINPGPEGTADIALTLTEPLKLGYLQVWPHARPMRMRAPVPVLRCVPDGATVGALLTRALLDAVRGGRRIDPALEADTGPVRDTVPAFAHAAAA